MNPYDYQNLETYTFVRWTMLNSPVDEMIDHAFRLASEDPDYIPEMEIEDFAEIVKRRLAVLLDHELVWWVNDQHFESITVTPIKGDPRPCISGYGLEDWDWDQEGDSEVNHGHKGLWALIAPMFWLSSLKINFEVAAESILKAKGKWNPDRTEHFPLGSDQ